MLYAPDAFIIVSLWFAFDFVEILNFLSSIASLPESLSLSSPESLSLSLKVSLKPHC